jgi:hypothetical protein
MIDRPLSNISIGSVYPIVPSRRDQHRQALVEAEAIAAGRFLEPVGVKLETLPQMNLT